MKLRSLPTFAVLVLAAGCLEAATRTQTVSLDQGWNAVWIEVEPRDADGRLLAPEVVFSAYPEVDIVSRLIPARSPREFVQDPSAGSLGADHWLKWRRHTVIGQNTLGGIRGNTAYLIHNGSNSPQPLEVAITGEVSFPTYSWVPDSYNFFGVPVGASVPTFSEFFGASQAHPIGRIFKLSAGQWVGVQGHERMRRDAAYWVYCDGGSDFQGPVPVLFPNSGGRLAFGEKRETATITAGNLRASPSSLTIRREVGDPAILVESDGGAEVVNLAISEDGTGEIVARSTASARLAVSRQAGATTPVVEHLYRLEAELDSGNSYYQWMPLTASVPLDPSDPGGSGFLPGLWVGNVTITHTTSLVEGLAGAGVRLEPVNHQARFRVILHCDAAGQTRLLEHATLMQKQRPSEELPREMVIVVDDSKIGDFVGIEERGGKLVGKRFDTAAYDLPRLVIPPSSADDDPNFDLTTLSDDYRLSLDLDGTLAPGGVITTNPGTLVLDPWHRTNPFRHVFNPEHRKGFRIGREMRFEIDPAGSARAATLRGFGRTSLSGIFEESVSGLMKSGDTHQARGRFVLQRVSDVAELN